jgi:hypothetical protein
MKVFISTVMVCTVLCASFAWGQATQPPAKGSGNASTAARVTLPVPLDMAIGGQTTWDSFNGQEFPGAKVSLTVVPDQPEKGDSCLCLAGDFTHGGNYVETSKDLSDLGVDDLAAIRMRVKSDNVSDITVRLTDSTGQCFQHKGIPIDSDGKWHELVLDPSKIVGGEHWGGANDNHWHSPAKSVEIMIGPDRASNKLQPVLYLADATADSVQAAVAQPAAFRCDFGSAGQLPATWTVQGTAAIDREQQFVGRPSLRLARPAAGEEPPCSVVSPAFKASAGMWQISAACKTDLQSPDASYDGTIELQCLDAAGHSLSQIMLADKSGTANWQSIRQQVTMPPDVVTARFVVSIHKAGGSFWVSDLSASYLAVAPRKEHVISSLVFSTTRLGNLLFPGDKPIFTVTVQATRPLHASQLQLKYLVRDYWGAEQAAPAQVALTQAEGTAINSITPRGST